MTSFKNNLTLTMAGAAMILGAQAGLATEQIAAKVPFEFRVGSSKFAAGSYTVSALNTRTGLKTYTLRNAASGKTILVVPNSPIQSSSSNVPPHFVFRCGEQSGCSLGEIWSGDTRGWYVKSPSLTPAEKERLASVALVPVANGE